MKMKVQTHTVVMNKSHCARATGPPVTIVDWGPLRLKTSASLQPDKKTRPSPAKNAVAKRETLRWSKRMRVMCNSGGISRVRCVNAKGQRLQKIPRFNYKT